MNYLLAKAGENPQLLSLGVKTEETRRKVACDMMVGGSGKGRVIIWCDIAQRRRTDPFATPSVPLTTLFPAPTKDRRPAPRRARHSKTKVCNYFPGGTG